jgi:hypothetical protein
MNKNNKKEIVKKHIENKKDPKKIKKNYIVSFKLDKKLYDRLSIIDDKSEFIRNAIFDALENICPFCNGKGVLNQFQMEHLNNFLKDHKIKKCEKCGELYIECKKK